MRLSLKSGTTKTESVEVEDSANVKTLREKVATTFTSKPEQVVLIFAGKIIKDDQTLEALKITDGHAIHVVLKKGAKAPAQPSQKLETLITGRAILLKTSRVFSLARLIL